MVGMGVRGCGEEVRDTQYRDSVLSVGMLTINARKGEIGVLTCKMCVPAIKQEQETHFEFHYYKGELE